MVAGSRMLLLTVAFSCFSDRAWSFVAPIVLGRTCPQQSTFLSSIYSFTELAFVAVLASPAGSLLARLPRLTAYKAAIVAQNLLTAVACGLLALLVIIFNRNEFPSAAVSLSSSLSLAEASFDVMKYDSRRDWRFMVPFSVLCLAGGMASVISISAKVLLSKDMLLLAVRKEAKAQVESEAAAASAGEEHNVESSEAFKAASDVGLAKANSLFSLIDLSMAVFAPVVVGLMCDSIWWKSDTEEKTTLSTLMGSLWAAIFVGAWNVVSCVPEVFIPNVVAAKYGLVELYSSQKQQHESLLSTTADGGSEGANSPSPPAAPKTSKSASIMKETLTNFVVLVKQPAFLGFFAFALLYCTVLTPHSSVLVSYLVGTRQFSSIVISIFAAVSQVIGMLGLQLPPVLIKRRWSSASVAVLGLFIQAILLVLCTASFSVDVALFSSPASAKRTVLSSLPSSTSSSNSGGSVVSHWTFAAVYTALAAMSLSRYGLWMADSAVALLLQQTVESEHISTVNGSLQALYSVCSAVALIVAIFTPVSLFIVVVAVSFVAVFMALVLFSIYWLRSRGKQAAVPIPLEPTDA